MKKNKKEDRRVKKLSLSTETLLNLDRELLKVVNGEIGQSPVVCDTNPRKCY